ncbi:MAG TPA: TatD family hydrolase [Candidatus Gracilibacteria bacterium]
MKIFETHAHLYFPAFSHPEEVIQSCREAGIDRQVQIGCDEISSLAALAMAHAFDGIYCAIGLHPCDVLKIGQRSAYHRYQGFEDYDLKCHNLDELIQFLADLYREGDNAKRIVAFGETGFDLYHENTPALFKAQYDSFLAHLELCAEFDKPVVIHNRNTRNEFLEFWGKNLEIRGGASYFQNQRIRGIVHCFGEDLEYAEKVTRDFGLKLGIGGPCTYPKAGNIREVIKTIPLEHLLTETDSPFLPPQSIRDQGIKLNSPAYLPEVVGVIAQQKAMDPDACAEVLYQNARDLFSV